MSTEAKKQIGTHSGSFHCDEALACFLLRQTKEYKDAEVIRSRDEKVLSKLPIIVDVGSEFIPEKGRFDHHQKSFTETFSPLHKIKLSSAGLIYKYFGKEIIKSLVNPSEADLDVIYNKVYDSFIQGLDGIDNGVPRYPPGVTAAYEIHTDLSARVGKLNPAWNEEEKDIDMQARFHQAMELAGKEFVETVLATAKIWLPARAIVKEAIEKRFDIHPSGEVICLPRSTVWKDHLFSLETEMKISPPILYVLYQDVSKSWRIQAVPEKFDSFLSRYPLPQAWRGVRDADLSSVIGLPGCVFAHATGFIGGHQTKEGVIEMAKRALAMREKVDEEGEKTSKKQKVEA